MNIKTEAINKEVAKNIFGNIENAKKYLLILNKCDVVEIKTKMSRGNIKLDLKGDEIWRTIIDTWNYELAKKIIRDMYRETDKYKRGKESLKIYKQCIEDWKDAGLEVIEWPYQSTGYDAFVQHINNNNNLIQSEKDTKLSVGAIQYGRMKQLNTARNDYIEFMIFESNDDIVPTLQHRKGCDFYIYGEKYDQKVAKSPTTQFKNDFGNEWKNKAKQNPDLVAEYLYKYQDSARFDANNRLLIVSLEEELDLEQGYDWKLTKPSKINFVYTNDKGDTKEYTDVECFVILLTNKDNYE